MPTYQYACTECGHRFEAVQAFSDDALSQCPECEGKLRKVYGSVGVVFKGSGFYRNDARGDSKSTSTTVTPAKESGSKDSGSKDSGSKESSTSSTASKDSSSSSASTTSSSSKPSSSSSSSSSAAAS